MSRSKDAGPSWNPQYQLTSSADLTTAADCTGSPASGKVIVLDDLVISTDTNMRVDIREKTDDSVLFSAYMSANVPAQFTLRNHVCKSTTADDPLEAIASAAGNIRVLCSWHSE